MGVWNWPWRARSSGFGSSSTAEEVTEGIDASHLTAIVTGATNGIGKETARVLALRGAKVIILSRTMESGMKVKESLLEQNPDANLHVMEMDLSSLSSVDSFARSFDASNKHLNILINNAGIMACPFQLSRDGIELQFAANHLATAQETGIQGRIVNVSSIAHKGGDESWLDLDKLNDKSRYKAFGAYCNSKLANILHANELSRRFQEEGSNVMVNSLHPGAIYTNLPRHLNFKVALTLISILAKPFLKTIPQGAATTCYLGLHPSAANITGKYFADCNVAEPSEKAKDGALGKRLWEFSQELLLKQKMEP
ncbi:short-chain dehydrogenase TIC 32, chloroplastic-like isoform X2 [Phoenix dactylifera]|uniref:Short-chain dehydrogenase TIC 32, chloroplastic-like isoform X2 n=1 Tax=Phoenix dactylifera TaxID=42345 RepID=A0A8B8J110_PHODC|nr:short-chain dehydrogenase TIC 32, chloroplastic-like isoform X2 [Phoenix dactylifera]